MSLVIFYENKTKNVVLFDSFRLFVQVHIIEEKKHSSTRKGVENITHSKSGWPNECALQIIC